MNQPEFPKEFVQKHCSKVGEARQWRKNFGLPPDPEDDMAYAECAFHRAGVGLKCESCDLFISRPDFMEYDRDKYFEQIEKFNRDLEDYDKWLSESTAVKGAFI